MDQAAIVEKIPVGIGACLLGEPVRFNGFGKKHNPVLDALSECFAWRAFCPEVAIGLGVPRPPIRLVGALGAERAVDSATGKRDVTAALHDFAQTVHAANADLCGYIFVKASPSCGLERVKRYSNTGHLQYSDAVGIFAKTLIDQNPLLPVEEDGRLHDEHLRESFVASVFTYFHWRQLVSAGLTPHTLQQFYARHKYLVMSRHVPTYQQLGKLLADVSKQPLAEIAAKTIELIMSAIKRPATRGGHTNVLMHIRGYLKNDLERAEKSELSELIEQYQRGHVPLIVPLTLLRHHFRNHPDAYIEQQVFMRPYPEHLRLRNRI